MPRAAATFQHIPAPLLVLAAIAGIAPSALAQSFTLMGTLPTYTISQNTGLSADGIVAAGYHGGGGLVRGFTWSAANGRNDFGANLPVAAYVTGISGNGQTVIGTRSNGNAQAFRWSQSDGYQTLGVLPGYLFSEGFDANFDGSIVVGTLSNGSGSEPQAFRWTQATGMQGLGFGTRAAAISGDGSTIVGGTGSVGNRPFTWTSSAGMQFLTTLDGTSSGSANGVNHDGTVMVGESGTAFRGTMWVNGVPLDITGGSTSANFSPTGVDDVGSIVVGQLNASGQSLTAGVWTASTSLMRLSDYLIANGVTIPVGVALTNCTAVSADGRTFAGYTEGSMGRQGFVATIPTPCPADLDNDGLFSNGGTRDRAVTIVDLLFLLAAFESGNLAADLDNGSNTGTRDNAVTIDDLLYFLTHFEAGC